MGLTLTLTGADGLRAALEPLAAAIEQGARLGAWQGAEHIAQLARAQSPVQTGALRQSIVCRAGAAPACAEAAVCAPHAVYVELGTARMPARPFLLPAFSQGRGAAVQAVAAAIREAVNA